MPHFLEISVGARNSPLSRKQVDEVYAELKAYFPDIRFQTTYVETTGDKDKTVSLRDLDKTDLFTREIDEMLLRKECRIAIHSAKDLPDPLPKGLYLAALTKGVDPSDALVLREGESLPTRGVVGTSSLRREESVKELFPDAQFIDIRGNIQERLGKLNAGEVDGVVIAEAALIRLELTHLNRLRLPGQPAPLQGRLAVVVREEDWVMRQFLSLL